METEHTTQEQKTQKNWFRRHPVFSGIIGLLLFFWLVGFITEATSKNTSSTNTQAAAQFTPTLQPTVTGTLEQSIHVTQKKVNAQLSELQKVLPTNTATPKKPMTLEDKIRAKLNLGEDTKVTEVSTETDADPLTDKELPGKIAVLISYHMNGTYLDTSWTKRGSWNIDTGIMKDIFPLDVNINTVVMTAEVPVTTAYGNDTFSTLDTITIKRDTFIKINFSKFDSQNLPSIADHYLENHNISD